MLLIDYVKNIDWYKVYADEIFAGISINDIEIDFVKIIDFDKDQVLRFSVSYCEAVYHKLLETNEKSDISVYLSALKIAAYDPEYVLSSIYNKYPNYFINRPVLFLLIFSRENMFNYYMVRKMYEDWYEYR